MYRGLVLLFALVASTNGKVVPVPEQSERIAGGVDATIESVPYQIEILTPKGHHCGGSILSPRVVITATHCVNNSSLTYSVQYGSNKVGNGKDVKIARIELHEGFKWSTIENDVAIIHLAEDIEFGPNAKPIALANKSPAPGTDAVVSGWGLTPEGPPKILQKVNNKILDHSKCKEKYENLKKYGRMGSSTIVTVDMLCSEYYAEYKTACKGDSGGPLVANNELVGIVSWGYTDQFGCGVLGSSNVFADVAHHRQWIERKMKQD